jgi:hypothetical protein
VFCMEVLLFMFLKCSYIKHKPTAVIRFMQCTALVVDLVLYDERAQPLFVLLCYRTSWVLWMVELVP